jgi:hypothetical protein
MCSCRFQDIIYYIEYQKKQTYETSNPIKIYFSQWRIIINLLQSRIIYKAQTGMCRSHENIIWNRTKDIVLIKTKNKININLLIRFFNV